MKTFFDHLRAKGEIPEVGKTAVVLTSYSQPHVLQQRMREERLSHGDRVKADIGPVRLESNFGKMVMYFCPMQFLNVNETIGKGDGAAIPAEAIIDGFESLIPANTKPGLYLLKNVELFSNGTMQVIAGEDTKFIDINEQVRMYGYESARRFNNEREIDRHRPQHFPF